MKILIQVLFLLILTMNCSSQTERWVLYYSDPSINCKNCNFYIDNQTISYVGTNVYIWEKQVVPGGYDSHGYIDYTLLRLEISCNTMSYRVLSLITYYIDGGSITDDWQSPTYYAEPDSFREKTINFVCK